jgi:hypothetical protein
MTYDEASEYVWQATEAEGEQRAEYGMGAVSLGYDGAEWAVAYDGYRTSDDPQFAEAQRLLADRYRTVRVIYRNLRPDLTIPF